MYYGIGGHVLCIGALIYSVYSYIYIYIYIYEL